MPRARRPITNPWTMPRTTAPLVTSASPQTCARVQLFAAVPQKNLLRFASQPLRAHGPSSADHGASPLDELGDQEGPPHEQRARRRRLGPSLVPLIVAPGWLDQLG